MPVSRVELQEDKRKETNVRFFLNSRDTGCGVFRNYNFSVNLKVFYFFFFKQSGFASFLESQVPSLRMLAPVTSCRGLCYQHHRMVCRLGMSKQREGRSGDLHIPSECEQFSFLCLEPELEGLYLELSLFTHMLASQFQPALHSGGGILEEKQW